MKNENTDQDSASPQSRKRLIFRARDAVVAPVYIEFHQPLHQPQVTLSDRISTRYPIYENLI